jgi:hypothetical protein
MNGHRLALSIALGFSAIPLQALAQCPATMVQSGPTGIDRFEASLWKVTNPSCIALIRQGRELPPFCLQQATQVGVAGSGGSGELAGAYAVDRNGAPNSIGDASAAGFRCAK